MLPIAIQQTLYWGVVKQIETLEKYYGYLGDLDFMLKPSPIEIENLIINIKKSLTYLDEYCQIPTDLLKSDLNKIKDQPWPADLTLVLV